MIRRILLIAAAPVVALLAIGPVLDRLADRLAEAPRRLPEENGMAIMLDRLGGEVVRLRSRDGLRLTGRWLAAEASEPASGTSEPTVEGPAVAEEGPAVAEEGPDLGSGGASGSPWIPDPREAILLLHGYSGSVTPDLLELGPFLRQTAGVLGLDFRGHGGSDAAPTTFGLHEVEDVAGALAWLAERGIRRVALVGSSMGGITAIASVAVLGDGRLPTVDGDPGGPSAGDGVRPPRIVAVVADSVTPELALVVANRLRLPFGRRIANQAFARMATRVGGDPRATQPIDVVGLLEDVPLLLVHGGRDQSVRIADARRLAAAAPPGTRHLVIEGAEHARSHAVDPAAYEGAVTALLREAFAVARG